MFQFPKQLLSIENRIWTKKHFIVHAGVGGTVLWRTGDAKSNYNRLPSKTASLKPFPLHELWMVSLVFGFTLKSVNVLRLLQFYRFFEFKPVLFFKWHLELFSVESLSFLWQKGILHWLVWFLRFFTPKIPIIIILIERTSIWIRNVGICC